MLRLSHVLRAYTPVRMRGCATSPVLCARVVSGSPLQQQREQRPAPTPTVDTATACASPGRAGPPRHLFPLGNRSRAARRRGCLRESRRVVLRVHTPVHHPPRHSVAQPRRCSSAPSAWRQRHAAHPAPPALCASVHSRKRVPPSHTHNHTTTHTNTPASVTCSDAATLRSAAAAAAAARSARNRACAHALALSRESHPP